MTTLTKPKQSFPVRMDPQVRARKLQNVHARITDIEGEYAIQVENGKIVGFRLIAGENVSEFIVSADRFKIENATGSPFEVIGDTVYIRNVVIQEEGVDNSKLAARATFDFESVFADYAGHRTTPGYGTWNNVTNGTTAMQVQVTTGKGSNQVVNLSFLASLKGDGGAADNLSVRVQRTGGTGGAVVLQTYTDMQVLNDRTMPYAFEFIDDAVAEEVTYTYTVQWSPIADGWPYWYNQFLKGVVYRR